MHKVGAAEEYFYRTPVQLFSPLHCLYKPQPVSCSSQEFKDREGKFEDKAWEEVKRGNYLDTESEGGRTSQGRESNKWRETDLESEDREQGLSEG